MQKQSKNTINKTNYSKILSDKKIEIEKAECCGHCIRTDHTVLWDDPYCLWHDEYVPETSYCRKFKKEET